MKTRAENDEVLRLSVLRSLQILDTPIERAFERIGRLLRRTLGCPISTISFVDEERVWFKSAQGLDVFEVPRTESFAAHTILSPDVSVVPDATQDDRFRGVPLVTGPTRVRFYAGCPITLMDGVRVGAVAVCRQEPWELDPDNMQFLQDMTESVRSQLRNRFVTMVFRESK